MTSREFKVFFGIVSFTWAGIVTSVATEVSTTFLRNASGHMVLFPCGVVLIFGGAFLFIVVPLGAIHKYVKGQ